MLSLRISFIFLGLFLGFACPQAFSQNVRSYALPSFCESIFPKLLSQEKRALSNFERRTLFRLARLPHEKAQAEIAGLEPEEGRALLEKLIVLRGQIRSFLPHQIPQENRPSLEEILELFPNAKTHLPFNAEMQDSLERAFLVKKVDAVSEQLASHLGNTTTAKEKRELFKFFLSQLDSHELSWFHQSRLDTLIDLASGIQTRSISQKIQKESREAFNEKHQGEETYSFASPELLLTPYSEILNLFRAVGLKPGDSVVDLGAGFGRLGLALGEMVPGVSVTGYEIVKDRIEEGARVAKSWGLDSRIHLLEQNLADPDFKPASADVYFAFNPVSGETFDKILEDLRQVGLKSGKRFKFIVFGPSPFEKTDAQPWLRELKGSEIPEGEELKIYEFVPEKASHTEKVVPKKENPYAVKPRVSSLGPADLEWIQKLEAGTPTQDLNTASFLSPHYLTAWADSWPIQKESRGNQVLIFTKKTGGSSNETYIEPLGGSAQEKAALIREVLKEKKSKGIKAEFTYLSKAVRDLLESEKEIVVEKDPHYSDFVYPAEQLAKLEQSKRLRDRGKQSQAFQSANPEAQVQILSRLSREEQTEFLTDTGRFLDNWLEGRLAKEERDPFDKDVIETETRTAQVLRTQLNSPRSIQIALRGPKNTSGQQGPVIAYASGEVRPGPQGKNMLVIYVQKSDGTRHSIQFLNQKMVREVLAHPERYGAIDYVNMMDASSEGLKQFKMQYEPDSSLGTAFRAFVP